MPWVCPIIAEDPEEPDYISTPAATPPRKRYTYGLTSRSRSRSSSASSCSSSSSGSPDRSAQGPRPHSLFWPPASSSEDSDRENEEEEGRPTPRDFSTKEMQMLNRQQSGGYMRKKKRGREVLRFQPGRKGMDMDEQE